MGRGTRTRIRREHRLSTYVVCAGFDLCVELRLVLVPEGRVADQQDVQDHAAGPLRTAMNVNVYILNSYVLWVNVNVNVNANAITSEGEGKGEGECARVHTMSTGLA